MSDPVFADFDEFEFEPFVAEEKKPEGKKALSVLKIVVVLLAIFVLAEALLYKFVLPCLTFPDINFSGVDEKTAMELRSVLMENGEFTWLSFDAERASSVLSEVSSVESVTIDKHFPDSIDIHIVERIPVAKAVFLINGKMRGVQIDRNGVIFSSPVFSDVAKNSSIPVLSGFKEENLHEGMRLPEKYRPLMNQLYQIEKLPQKYFSAISEIRVVAKTYGNYELVLYPVKNRIKVITDRALNEDALKYMMVALDVVNTIEPDVTELDLRYGSVSYRKNTPFLPGVQEERL
ncbi:MAG: FtsQ-type POTRA domain-containing protein [Treponema sp.]|nr:FtsQ-type POTRA domain-containing protein [Treponema sp.]